MTISNMVMQAAPVPNGQQYRRGGRRSMVKFLEEDLYMLFQEMKERIHSLLGQQSSKPGRGVSHAACKEVALALSANFLTTKTAEQCRNKFNDLITSDKCEA